MRHRPIVSIAFIAVTVLATGVAAFGYLSIQLDRARKLSLRSHADLQLLAYLHWHDNGAGATALLQDSWTNRLASGHTSDLAFAFHLATIALNNDDINARLEQLQSALAIAEAAGPESHSLLGGSEIVPIATKRVLYQYDDTLEMILAGQIKTLFQLRKPEAFESMLRMFELTDENPKFIDVAQFDSYASLIQRDGRDFHPPEKLEVLNRLAALGRRAGIQGGVHRYTSALHMRIDYFVALNNCSDAKRDIQEAIRFIQDEGGSHAPHAELALWEDQMKSLDILCGDL